MVVDPVQMEEEVEVEEGKGRRQKVVVLWLMQTHLTTSKRRSEHDQVLCSAHGEQATVVDS